MTLTSTVELRAAKADGRRPVIRIVEDAEGRAFLESAQDYAWHARRRRHRISKRLFEELKELVLAIKSAPLETGHYNLRGTHYFLSVSGPEGNEDFECFAGTVRAGYCAQFEALLADFVTPEAAVAV